jgi:2Fe-2S ferredoxin
MTQIIVLPHVELCPEGAVIEAEEGKSICENLLGQRDRTRPRLRDVLRLHDLPRHRARGFQFSGASRGYSKRICSTRPGAWSRTPASVVRLSVADTPLTVEIPKYSINMAKEGHRK